MSKKKHFISLSISSFGTPIMSFVIVILLTKEMNPDIYGQYVYVIGFYNFIFHIISFGFPSTIRLCAGRCQNDLEKTEIISGALAYATLSSGMLMLVVFFTSSILYYFNKTIPFDVIIIIIPFSIVYLLTAVLDNLLQGLSYLTILAVNRMLPVIIFLIIVGVSTLLETNMIYYLFMWHLSFLSVYIIVFLLFKKNLSYSVLSKSLKNIFEINKNFGINVYLGNVLLLAGMSFGPILIGLLTDNKSQIAYYALGLSLTSPLTILPQLFSTVYFKEFIKEKKIANKIFFSVFSFTFVLGAILFILAPIIVKMAYGIKFINAVGPLKILIVASLVNGINLFIDRFFHAKGAGEIIRNSAFIAGLTLLLSYLLFVPNYLAIGAAIAMVISSVVNLSYRLRKYVEYAR